MHDVIVIGLGSAGSSTLFQLAKRGVKVLGIEQFGITHDRGSHGGNTRIIRKAYFEHPNYVPLLEQAYLGWNELDQLTGKQHYFETGLAYIGKSDHELLLGVKRSARQYGIRLNFNSPASFSKFNVPVSSETFLEPKAGFVLAGDAIKSYIGLATKLGAEIKTQEEVLGWRLKDGTVSVLTNQNEYHAAKLIITAGAYVKHLYSALSDSLKVTRQLIGWVKSENKLNYVLGNFPCWMIADEDNAGLFYGFPVIDPLKFGGNGMLKIAHHTIMEETDPAAIHLFDANPEILKLQRIIDEYLPNTNGRVAEVTACLYTNTPDGHFILDYLPGTNEQVIIGSGFSGHGFKFIPVIGQVLSDLAQNLIPNHDIDFLRIDRESLNS